MQDKFNTIISNHDTRLKKDNTLFNIVGYIKLFLALLIGISIYFMITNNFSLEFIILFSIALFALIALWIYHNRLHNNIVYSKGIIDICNRHIDRITGKWTTFEDIGDEFVNVDHAYACDLDIVGKKSLFQLLNTTHTWHGRQAFANDMLNSKYGQQELNERQRAISELSGDVAFAGNIEYHLSKIGVDSGVINLVAELKDDKPFLKHRAVKLLLTYVPMLTTIFIAGIIIFQQKNLYLYGALIVAIQAAVWVAGIPKAYRYLGAVSGLPYKVSSYSNVIDILMEKDFSSKKLKQINEQLNMAAQAIRDLSKIADKVNVRHNGIIYFILNIFLLWDYECAIQLEHWKRKYAPLSEQWFKAVGEFESLLCFSHLPNVCDNTCLPVISGENSKIEANEMGHPLILNDNRVNNNFRLGNNILIISGSNMSGKTTFLRTVGINLILARSGGFVCAEKMSCTLLDIVTSMRIADDLSEGISTFYAELKRIKGIIDAAENHIETIFLIDEIFRGTNSVDRLIGAKTVIKRLNDLGVVGLISTHDLELCELSDIYDRIVNYSFSEDYRENKICFDYKMKPGKSSTTNARFLMRMVGIVY